jgi:hypothetical protein
VVVTCRDGTSDKWHGFSIALDLPVFNRYISLLVTLNTMVEQHLSWDTSEAKRQE